jgi:hypothetical protein
MVASFFAFAVYAFAAQLARSVLDVSLVSFSARSEHEKYLFEASNSTLSHSKERSLRTHVCAKSI